MPPKKIVNQTHMRASDHHAPGFDKALGTAAHLGIGFATKGYTGALGAGVSLATGTTNPSGAGKIIRRFFDSGQTITEFDDGVTMIECQTYDGDPDITFWKDGRMIPDPY